MIATLREQRAKTETQADVWNDSVEKTFRFATHAIEGFQKGDMNTKREILKALGTNFLLKDGKIHLDLHPWFTPIREAIAETQRKHGGIEPIKKGSVERTTKPSEDEILIWLPEDPQRQAIILQFCESLVRRHQSIIAFFAKHSKPVAPAGVVQIVKPTVAKIPKIRKKFDRDEAQKMLALGSSYAEIGRKFGVSRSAIYKALKKL